MTAATVDEYIAAQPAEIAERLHAIRSQITAAVAEVSGSEPEERVRYGMPAVMLSGRYALHFAAWKRHIGLYPVSHGLPADLEAEVSPYRSEKDSVTFPHSKPIPYDLVGRLAAELARQHQAD